MPVALPKPLVYTIIVVVLLATIPPALIGRARTRTTDSRRIHLIQDMDNQAKFRAQHANPLFADGRAMRQPVAGTVARGELLEDEHYAQGVLGGGWAERCPPQIDVTMTLLRRGGERFDIYCAVCHGVAGYGDGIINKRAMELMNNPAIGNGTTWVQPKNIHEPEIRAQPIGQIYNTITNGIRNMSGYSAQIPIEDRWAIAVYVKALQRSQNARPDDLAPGRFETLPVEDLRPEETE